MGGQGGCERRIEVLVKFKKKLGEGGGVGGGVRLGVQGRCEPRSEGFVKIQKKNGGGERVRVGRGVFFLFFFFVFLGGGGGGQGGCERRIEVLVKIQTNKSGVWGRSGRGGGGG